MKLWVIINSLQPIEKLVQLKMNVQDAFDLLRFVKSLDPEIKSFNELREAKIKELWEEKEGVTRVKPENEPEFYKYLDELAQKEIDIQPPKIKKEELKGDIEVSTLSALDFLFE